MSETPWESPHAACALHAVPQILHDRKVTPIQGGQHLDDVIPAILQEPGDQVW